MLVAVGFWLAWPGHAWAAGGQISGTVTDALSVSPIGNVQIDVYDSSRNFVTSTQTASNGTYTVSGLSTGTYEAGFVPTSGNYLPQFYSGKASLAAGNAVSVTAGSTTLGINAALATGGQISGTVTDAATHVALGSVEVDAYDASENFVTSTLSAVDGSYTLSGLSTGSYEVGLVPASSSYATQFYNGKPSLAAADAVSVTAGATTTINAALAAGGQITGMVTDAALGGPVPTVEVDVYDVGDNFVTSTLTAADGTYTLAGLFPGSYEVGFVPTSGNYASQFYNARTSLAAANPVSVAGGSTTTVNAALAAGGQISGIVTDAFTGAGVGRVQVEVYDSRGTLITSAPTASDGTYAVLGLPAGSYKVGFFPVGPHAAQFYSGRASLAAADAISVTAGVTTSGIDAALKPPTSTLSVALVGNGSGTVTGTGISCPGACSQSYPTNTSVTLTASPAAGSTFGGWLGGGCGAAAGCTVVLSSPLAVTAVFSANTVAAVSPPSNHVLPSVSGNATTGQTLSAHTGSWSGTSPLAYSYQWQRCAAGCGNVPGATGSSYRLGAADTGARILVVVTAGNAAGRASVRSPSVGPVGPSVAQIKSLLSAGLVPSGKSARIRAILKAGGYTFTVKAAAAGQEDIRWYVVPMLKNKARKPVLVATGKLVFARAGSGKLKLKLSAAGRHALKHAKRIKLSAKASFTPTGKSPVSLIWGFRLR